jgi:hypothetical protein
LSVHHYTAEELDLEPAEAVALGVLA